MVSQTVLNSNYKPLIDHKRQLLWLIYAIQCLNNNIIFINPMESIPKNIIHNDNE